MVIPPLFVVKHTLLTVASVAEIFLVIKLETVPDTDYVSDGSATVSTPMVSTEAFGEVANVSKSIIISDNIFFFLLS